MTNDHCDSFSKR